MKISNPACGLLFIGISIAGFLLALIVNPAFGAIPTLLLILVAYRWELAVRRKLGRVTVWSDIFPEIVKED